MILDTEVELGRIQQEVIACEQCPRLVAYRRDVARTRRAAFRNEDYWGRPVPSFGDPQARLLIVGLAPAAHGGNRTGRMFTGDRSGDFLYAALFRAGFANQPTSISREDGLRLTDVYISASARCAPPDNKPLPEELARCRVFLTRELMLLTRLQVILALGKIAFDTVTQVLADAGHIARRPKPAFGHGVICAAGPYALAGCYHPSQRNTSTKLVTPEMYDQMFGRVKAMLK
ncbi:MAG: uracil-DNA glycosylase [Anaerolineae bacterium]